MTVISSLEKTDPHIELPFVPYLLNSRNGDFYLGKARYIADARFDWSWASFGESMSSIANAVAVPGIVLLLSMGLASLNLFDNQFYVTLIVGSIVGMIILCSISVMTSIRLSRSGRILPGSVTKAKRRYYKDGEYQVTVWYSFVSPTGEQVSGKNSASRSDLPPDPGRPVAVIYLDDKHFRML